MSGEFPLFSRPVVVRIGAESHPVSQETLRDLAEIEQLARKKKKAVSPSKEKQQPVLVPAQNQILQQTTQVLEGKSRVDALRDEVLSHPLYAEMVRLEDQIALQKQQMGALQGEIETLRHQSMLLRRGDPRMESEHRRADALQAKIDSTRNRITRLNRERAVEMKRVEILRLRLQQQQHPEMQQGSRNDSYFGLQQQQQQQQQTQFGSGGFLSPLPATANHDFPRSSTTTPSTTMPAEERSMLRAASASSSTRKVSKQRKQEKEQALQREREKAIEEELDKRIREMEYHVRTLKTAETTESRRFRGDLHLLRNDAEQLEKEIAEMREIVRDRLNTSRSNQLVIRGYLLLKKVRNMSRARRQKAKRASAKTQGSSGAPGVQSSSSLPAEAEAEASALAPTGATNDADISILALKSGLRDTSQAAMLAAYKAAQQEKAKKKKPASRKRVGLRKPPPRPKVPEIDPPTPRDEADDIDSHDLSGNHETGGQDIKFFNRPNSRLGDYDDDDTDGDGESDLEDDDDGDDEDNEDNEDSDLQSLDSDTRRRLMSTKGFFSDEEESSESREKPPSSAMEAKSMGSGAAGPGSRAASASAAAAITVSSSSSSKLASRSVKPTRSDAKQTSSASEHIYDPSMFSSPPRATRNAGPASLKGKVRLDDSVDGSDEEGEPVSAQTPMMTRHSTDEEAISSTEMLHSRSRSLRGEGSALNPNRSAAAATLMAGSPMRRSSLKNTAGSPNLAPQSRSSEVRGSIDGIGSVERNSRDHGDDDDDDDKDDGHDGENSFLSRLTGHSPRNRSISHLPHLEAMSAAAAERRGSVSTVRFEEDDASTRTSSTKPGHRSGSVSISQANASSNPGAPSEKPDIVKRMFEIHHNMHDVIFGQSMEDLFAGIARPTDTYSRTTVGFQSENVQKVSESRAMGKALRAKGERDQEREREETEKENEKEKEKLHEHGQEEGQDKKKKSSVEFMLSTGMADVIFGTWEPDLWAYAKNNNVDAETTSNASRTSLLSGVGSSPGNAPGTAAPKDVASRKLQAAKKKAQFTIHQGMHDIIFGQSMDNLFEEVQRNSENYSRLLSVQGSH